jgi:hypothetical protein
MFSSTKILLLSYKHPRKAPNLHTIKFNAPNFDNLNLNTPNLSSHSEVSYVQIEVSHIQLPLFPTPIIL